MPSARAARTGTALAARTGTAIAKGFTLLELTVILLVVSIVMLLAAPTLKGFFTSRQTSDVALNVLSLTKWAHNEARTQGHICRLNIDASAGTYWLTVQDAGQFVPPVGEMGRTFHVPEDTSVSIASGSTAPQGNPPYVQFDPNGRSSVATIEIVGARGNVYQLVADSVSESFRIVTPTEAAR